MAARPVLIAITALAWGSTHCSEGGPSFGSVSAPLASAIEATYAAAGPQSAATLTIGDGDGAPLYEVFYPAGLTNGSQRPLLLWGNGTGATPGQYGKLLTHLASWGFVVIASTSQNVGSGAELLAAEDWMVAAHGDPASPFYGSLKLTAIGALGHSQGAGGTMRAVAIANGPGSTHLPIATALPIELPAQRWICFGSSDPACLDAQWYEGGDLTGCSVFFVNGSLDTLISPSTQGAWASGQQSNAAFYAAVPAGTPKAKATLVGANHNDIQDACSGSGCAGVGPTGYFGYVTAWLRYRLAADATARLAFAGASPELPQNGAWSNQASAGLP